MKRQTFALILTAACAGSAQAQVYKCPDASGRTVIQQMPCPGGTKMTVKPASGHATAPPLGADIIGPNGQGKPLSEAERLNALSDASARHRRKQDLEERIVPRARADMYGHRERCRQTQERLKQEQYEYVQNLYGKTHAAQIASEMAAQAATCDTKDRENTANFTQLLTECQGLDGCKDIKP